MNNLFAARRISDFRSVLEAYKKGGVPIRNCVDGGAGSGSTSRHMLKYSSGNVYAFEPFPGNHRFFETVPPQIRLMKYALDETPGFKAFRVASTVSTDSVWGQKGMAGYSSVGFLTSQPNEEDMRVECVRGDDLVDAPIDFLKLDLQGAELGALRGMSRIASECLFAWIEFSGQSGLLDYLQERFEVYDTEYFFLGEPSDEARELFDVSRENYTLSTGKTVWFGFRKRLWTDFPREFAECMRDFKMTQTDLICINRARLAEFEFAKANL